MRFATLLTAVGLLIGSAEACAGDSATTTPTASAAGAPDAASGGEQATPGAAGDAHHAEGGAQVGDGGRGPEGASGGEATESFGGDRFSEAGGPALGGAGASAGCEPVVMSRELAAGVHVDACTPIDYATNPPSSGEHYPTWADFGVYDFALPRGYWVHNLEHGAVVVTYNCDGCDAEIAAATSWVEQLTPDPGCPEGPPRVLLVPDPLLDVPWAASAWGFTLRAACFDTELFSSFVDNHVGQPSAPEGSLCAAGVDFRAEGAETCGAK